jgi:hypothetical protein
MAKKAAAKKTAVKLVNSYRKGGKKPAAAKKKAAKAVKRPAVKPMTIADEVAQVWPDISSLDPKQWLVGSLKAWLEEQVKGEKNTKEVRAKKMAITLLGCYDDTKSFANPFTERAE